jgi:hypothetical protein
MKTVVHLGFRNGFQAERVREREARIYSRRRQTWFLFFLPFPSKVPISTYQNAVTVSQLAPVSGSTERNTPILTEVWKRQLAIVTVRRLPDASQPDLGYQLA